nr:vegetative cell wall protein gp1-like [Aegilops tauschii subsp. strangulata]
MCLLGEHRVQIPPSLFDQSPYPSPLHLPRFVRVPRPLTAHPCSRWSARRYCQLLLCSTAACCYRLAPPLFRTSAQPFPTEPPPPANPAPALTSLALCRTRQPTRVAGSPAACSLLAQHPCPPSARSRVATAPPDAVPTPAGPRVNHRCPAAPFRPASSAPAARPPLAAPRHDRPGCYPLGPSTCWQPAPCYPAAVPGHCSPWPPAPSCAVLVQASGVDATPTPTRLADALTSLAIVPYVSYAEPIELRSPDADARIVFNLGTHRRASPNPSPLQLLTSRRAFVCLLGEHRIQIPPSLFDQSPCPSPLHLPRFVRVPRPLTARPCSRWCTCRYCLLLLCSTAACCYRLAPPLFRTSEQPFPTEPRPPANPAPALTSLALCRTRQPTRVTGSPAACSLLAQHPCPPSARS